MTRKKKARERSSKRAFEKTNRGPYKLRPLQYQGGVLKRKPKTDLKGTKD